MRRRVALLTGALLLLTGCGDGYLPTAAPPPPRPSAEEEVPAMTTPTSTEPTEAASPTPTPVTPTATPAPVPLSEAYEDGGLVDLCELSHDFVLDMKYATADNFTGIPHYERQLALLHKDAAALLLTAQARFLEDGYRIKIYDAYRPFRVQVSLYEAVPPHLSMFVAKPTRSARHCKGIAIDMTLVDPSGEELPMPSPFDTFDESAYVAYQGGTEGQRANRDYMVRVMEDCGFTVYDKEWWHFAVPELAHVETRDITFTEFLDGRAASGE